MPVALLFILTASFSMLVNAQVFRSACRRDVLMKMTDRNKKLVNTERDIISKKQVENVRFCVKDCNSESKCLSINFMQNGTTADEKNCHLLNITKANEVTTLAIAEGWVHYEPVTQVCRSGVQTWVYFNIYVYLRYWISVSTCTKMSAFLERWVFLRGWIIFSFLWNLILPFQLRTSLRKTQKPNVLKRNGKIKIELQNFFQQSNKAFVMVKFYCLACGNTYWAVFIFETILDKCYDVG